MSWRTVFTHKAEESLEKLSKEVGDKVLEKIVWLESNFDYIDPLPLRNKWRGFFKLRIGDWRVIYDANINKKEITIHKIGHRSKIY